MEVNSGCLGPLRSPSAASDDIGVWVYDPFVDMGELLHVVVKEHGAQGACVALVTFEFLNSLF